MYIYLDESGDLGFNERSSKHYVIAVLATHDPKTIENALKRYRTKIRTTSSKKYRKLGEFKFNKAPDNVKISILNIITSKDVKLGYVHVEKKQVYPRLHEKKNEFYAYVCKELLYRFLIEPHDPKKIHLIVDRQFAEKHRENFNNYLGWKIAELLGEAEVLNIAHRDSHQEPCLQAVDLVCGAIYRCYNRHDPKYFEIIKNKCIVKHEMWDVGKPSPTCPRYTSVLTDAVEPATM